MAIINMVKGCPIINMVKGCPIINMVKGCPKALEGDHAKWMAIGAKGINTVPRTPS